MQVRVDIEQTGDDDYNYGLAVTCSKCGECVEVSGTTERSARAACVQLRERCGESNFYAFEEGDLP